MRWVSETVSQEITRKSHFKLGQAAPVAQVAEFEHYDGIIVASGTRCGPISSQMASFLDQAAGLWARGALNGQIGRAFTSTATQHGGQVMPLFSIISNLTHFGMTIVGLPYLPPGQMTLDEIVGGALYGATIIAGTDCSRQPRVIELEGARHQGELLAGVAIKVHG